MSESTITLNFASAKPAGENATFNKNNEKPQSTRLPNVSFKRKHNKEFAENAREPKTFKKNTFDRPARDPKPKLNRSSNIELNKEPTRIPSKSTKPNNSKAHKDSDESSSEDSEHEARPAPEGTSKTIISSLFTKNPSISKEHSGARKALVPQLASNGVLSDAKSFVAAGLDRVLGKHLKEKMNLGKPTTVQSRAISFLSSSGERDLIIQAQTGSGKTLSFLLPIVDKLIKASGAVSPKDSFRPSRTSGVLAVVLAPTRELARQIYDVLEKLLNYPVVSDEELQRYHWIVPGLVVGGDKKASEKSRLRKGVNILVATPGRFLDHLQNTKCMNIDSLKWVVLDEGDRFLELGLQETLKSIFSILKNKSSISSTRYRGQWFWNSRSLPKERRTIMVSATLNSAVQTLAEYSLTNPMHITGDKAEEGSDSDESDDETETGTFATPQQLTQRYLVAPAKLRLVALSALLRNAFIDAKGKVIVFMLTCEEVEFYHGLFLKSGLEASSISPKQIGGHYTGAEAFFGLGSVIPGLPILKLHGNLDQTTRSGTYKAFCALESGVLFCTDVAARGLDLPRVAQIIQFDPPTDMKDYVHRVGRTARLGRAGDAVLFLLPSEVDYISRLASLKIRLHPATVEHVLKSLCDSSEPDYQAAATRWQNAFEKYVLSSKEVQEQAAKALTSSVRAYATHPSSEKDIFHIKKLHLGHWAKSFALREAPTEISKRMNTKSKADAVTKSKSAAVPSYASKAGSRTSAGFFDPASEFSSGAASSRPTGAKRRH